MEVVSAILPARYSVPGGHGKLGSNCCEVVGGSHRHFSENHDGQLYANDVYLLDTPYRSKPYDLGQYYQDDFVSSL